VSRILNMTAKRTLGGHSPIEFQALPVQLPRFSPGDKVRYLGTAVGKIKPKHLDKWLPAIVITETKFGEVALYDQGRFVRVHPTRVNDTTSPNAAIIQ